MKAIAQMICQTVCRGLESSRVTQCGVCQGFKESTPVIKNPRPLIGPPLHQSECAHLIMTSLQGTWRKSSCRPLNEEYRAAEAQIQLCTTVQTPDTLVSNRPKYAKSDPVLPLFCPHYAAVIPQLPLVISTSLPVKDRGVCGAAPWSPAGTTGSGSGK